jgi:hypothetical protein
MATKAFYRAKRDHMRPLRNVYSRAIRALESGVPIGRGHPWQIPVEEGEFGRRLPNWKQHEWTLNVASCLKQHPPKLWADERKTLKDIRETQKKLDVFLIKRFMRRHPEVVWKVPYDSISGKHWAPMLFAKRQAQLMRTQKLSEEDAYRAVVQEGGGGGDWNGVWESLEHDRIKNALKKEAMFAADDNQRKKNGISLLTAYYEAQQLDVKRGLTGAHQRPSRLAEKLLDDRTEAASKKEFFDDILDLGVLFKIRAIEEKRADQENGKEPQERSKGS